MATRMLQRRGTAAEWAAANPVLAQGEMGFETDTFIIKMGDGVTAWNDLGLPYLTTGGGTMTGALELIAPTDPVHAARLQDVDAVQADLDSKPVAAVELIETITLSANGSIIFDNIPQGFRNLRISALLKGEANSAATASYLRFNDDSGANYRYVSIRGIGTTNTVDNINSGGASSGLMGTVSGSESGTGTSKGPVDLLIPEYSSSEQKTWVSSGGTAATTTVGDFRVGSYSGRWTGTAGITKIQLLPFSGDWVVGSVATLYGWY